LQGAENRMSESTIRLLICSAKPGVNKAQVMEATKITNAVLRRMPGFVEHEIACAVFDEEWVDLVHWSDPGAASWAERMFKRHPAANAVASIVEQRWITPMQLEDISADRHLAYAY
jgi:hypothetical protein